MLDPSGAVGLAREASASGMASPACEKMIKANPSDPFTVCSIQMDYGSRGPPGAAGVLDLNMTSESGRAGGPAQAKHAQSQPNSPNLECMSWHEEFDTLHTRGV